MRWMATSDRKESIEIVASRVGGCGGGGGVGGGGVIGGGREYCDHNHARYAGTALHMSNATCLVANALCLGVSDALISMLWIRVTCDA